MPDEILIDVGPAETRVALVEAGRLAAVRIDRPRRESVVGTIWLGRVSRVLPGMQAAFVDIGLGRAGFLAARDARAAAGLAEDSATPPIQQLVREGQAVIVQASKDPLGEKGVKLTADLTLPGRLLVHTPFAAGVHVSRRIEDAAERGRMSAVLLALAREGGGFIVRTAAEGAEPEELAAEALRLRGEWAEIAARVPALKAPAVLWRDLDPVARALRDHLTARVAQVRINAPAAYAEARAYAAAALPGLEDRIALHRGPEPLFDLYDVEGDLDQALQKRVPLPSGGSITIEGTQALTAIDVDSGSYSGRGLEDTSLRTNVEAAAEIARQVRLRGIGGIIVIDFIHLQEPAHREQLLACLRQAFAGDRAPVRVLGLSEFGLVELTRKRTGDPLAWSLSEPCATCGGEGRVPSAAAVAATLLRRALREAARAPGRPIGLVAAPEVAAALEADGGLAELGRLAGAPVTMRADPSCRPGQYDVVVDQT